MVYHRRLAYCVSQVSRCGITDVLNTVSCWGGGGVQIQSCLFPFDASDVFAWRLERMFTIQVTRNQEATPVKMQHSVQVCDVIVHVPKVNNKLRQMNCKTVVPVKIVRPVK